mmetsp:Transcript_92808/g.289361  ORF Transcript_92808/g.289361 Transcript_92808/m.289361 type:complete len:110 (+) Transcript_92808:222-551(+)
MCLEEQHADLVMAALRRQDERRAACLVGRLEQPRRRSARCCSGQGRPASLGVSAPRGGQKLWGRVRSLHSREEAGEEGARLSKLGASPCGSGRAQRAVAMGSNPAPWAS